jgi:hypothetical protein
MTRVRENGNFRGRWDKNAALALTTKSPNHRNRNAMFGSSLLSGSLLNFDWCCVQFGGAAMLVCFIGLCLAAPLALLMLFAYAATSTDEMLDPI